VRFVVATYDTWFLKFGAETLGRTPLADHEPAGFVVGAKALETFYFELRGATSTPAPARQRAPGLGRRPRRAGLQDLGR
jgi:hypothetical protein